jgi:hypothetical protein
MLKSMMATCTHVAINDAQPAHSSDLSTHATAVAAESMPVREIRFKRFSAVLAVLDHVRLLFPIWSLRDSS